MAYIHLDNVDLSYPIFNANGRSLRRQLLQIGSGRMREDHGHVTVQALSRVSMRIEDGDRVGLIGFNGAGKTTLLRVLAGIYPPTAGTVQSEGRVAPFFEIASGFDLECTGYENIVLKAMSLGLSLKEARALREEVATFSELGNYLDVPVRTYSTGMLMRLAFAVCTSISADIVLMDEWIGVGDGHFLRKATDRLRDFVGRTRILVLASHSNDLILQLCNKAALMNGGVLVSMGPVEEVMGQYSVLGDSPFFLLDRYVEQNPDLEAAVRDGLVSAWTHFMSCGVFESRPLGNGVHLRQFSNDPVFLKAKEKGDAIAAIRRIGEVLPLLRSFEPPPGWKAPQGAPQLPFVPLDPADMRDEPLQVASNGQKIDAVAARA